MIPTFSPGTEYYADLIRNGDPFSLTRYGEGEWRVIVPEMHVKKQRVFSEWHEESAQEAMRQTLLQCHTSPRYCSAIWHQRYFARDGRAAKIESWLERNGLKWVPWHDGRVWRRAIENDAFSPVVSAIRDCALPLVIVGPKRIQKVTSEKFKVAKFIEIHPTHAYHERFSILGEIVSFGKPALISFSAGGTANILIHTLFPVIGERSLMIDFGASWEVLTGHKTRPYAKSVTKERLRKNWEGE